MQNPKGFADRLESWVAKIPGIPTYQNREHRRETDKHLREHLSSQLQEQRSRLKRLILNISPSQSLEPLVELDRLSSHIQQMADTIRYARYGYGGVFDLEKIREEELDRLYSFDLSLLKDLEGIQAKIEEMITAGSVEALRQKIVDAESLLDSLEEKFRQRSDFMNHPA